MIPIYSVKLKNLEKKYVNRCLDDGWVSSSGRFVSIFEREFAKYIGVSYALSAINGTSALHLLLLSANILPGDEVIVPDYTFISTALAISYIGAKPVFIDSEKGSWNINYRLIEKSITKKTKAILPVHIYGIPANLIKIITIAKRYNLIVLEDAAEALGAEINQKKVGSFSEGAIFSFYGNKTITTGEGGMLVTNSKKLYERAKSLRDYGRTSKQKYLHHFNGFNYRMTNIQAALGLGQLKRIKSILRRKRQIKEIYKSKLANIPGIIFQDLENDILDACWLVSIYIQPEIFGLSKEKLEKFLSEKRIETRGFFLPLHRQPIYRPEGKFPVADSLYENGLSLPSYPSMKNEQILYICKMIKEAYGNKKIAKERSF